MGKNTGGQSSMLLVSLILLFLCIHSLDNPEYKILHGPSQLQHHSVITIFCEDVYTHVCVQLQMRNCVGHVL